MEHAYLCRGHCGHANNGKWQIMQFLDFLTPTQSDNISDLPPSPFPFWILRCAPETKSYD